MKKLQNHSFTSRRTWRNWLQKHHDTSPGVWLVFYKQGAAKSSVTYPEAVEEALCFGWIDSQVHAMDGDRYRQRYTPRKENSVWSEANKERVERMIREGFMTEAGVAKIEAAKKNGSWDTLTDVDRLVVPPDLAKALAADKQAQANFETFTASERKMYLYWIASAKRDETRQRRIGETVARLAQNKNRTDS